PTDHVPEWRALGTGMRGDAGHEPDREQSKTRQGRADRHRADKAESLKQNEANRTTESECAVNCRADQRQDPSRATWTDEPNPPGNHPDSNQTLAESNNQPADDEDHERDHGRLR